MTIKISELPPGAAPSDPDVFAVVQGAVTVQVSWAQIAAEIVDAAAARVIDPSRYTNIPTGVGSIDFSDTTGLFPGTPLRVTQAGVDKRYVITSVTTNSSITVAGPQLTAAVTMTEIAVYPLGATVQADLILPGSYMVGGAGNLIDRTTRSRFYWQLPPAYLCYGKFSHATPDSDAGNQPVVNASLRGNNVFTSPVTLPNAAHNPVAVGDGTASLAEYMVNFNDEVEITLQPPAGQEDAKDLTAALTFVFA